MFRYALSVLFIAVTLIIVEADDLALTVSAVLGIVYDSLVSLYSLKRYAVS